MNKIAVNIDIGKGKNYFDSDLLAYAIRYAHLNSASLCIIITASEFLNNLYSAHRFAGELQTIEVNGRAIVDKAHLLAEEFKVEIDSKLIFGNFPQKLLETVESFDIELLIVGESKNSSFFDRLLDNPIARIVKCSKAEVLVVKPGYIIESTIAGATAPAHPPAESRYG